jgi:hypothetical protein
MPVFFPESRNFTRIRVRIRLRCPPRIPTFEEISRSSDKLPPDWPTCWRELCLCQGLCELLGDVSSPLSLRTRFGFPETETPVRRDEGSNGGQLLAEGQASWNHERELPLPSRGRRLSLLDFDRLKDLRRAQHHAAAISTATRTRPRAREAGADLGGRYRRRCTSIHHPRPQGPSSQRVSRPSRRRKSRKASLPANDKALCTRGRG